MSLDCSCDWDPATFYTARRPIARKAHRCYECGGIILKGEQYEYVSAMWEGELSDYHTCRHCVDLRTWVKNNVPCLCWMHGNADDSMREAIDEAYVRARDEVTGVRFGYLRRVFKRDADNAMRRLDLRIPLGASLKQIREHLAA